MNGCQGGGKAMHWTADPYGSIPGPCLEAFYGFGGTENTLSVFAHASRNPLKILEK